MTSDQRRFNAREMVDLFRRMTDAERGYFSALCDQINASTGPIRSAARREAELQVDPSLAQTDEPDPAADI